MKTGKFALLSIQDGPRYGKILSTHRTIEAAETALDKLCNAVYRRFPNALTHLMYEVCEMPTPAGERGKKGDRIAIDLSRR